jgi:hypothetical protein
MDLGSDCVFELPDDFPLSEDFASTPDRTTDDASRHTEKLKQMKIRLRLTIL